MHACKISARIAATGKGSFFIQSTQKNTKQLPQCISTQTCMSISWLTLLCVICPKKNVREGQRYTAVKKQGLQPSIYCSSCLLCCGGIMPNYFSISYLPPHQLNVHDFFFNWYRQWMLAVLGYSYYIGYSLLHRYIGYSLIIITGYPLFIIT